MEKRYVIGDIHGNDRAFIKLLDYVDPDPEELVILGDLSDRGLGTWQVYEECSLLLDEGADIVMGNHDFWLKEYLNRRLPASTLSSEVIGGITTIKSIELAIQKHGERHVRDTLFGVLNRMKPYVETDEFIFVHAGLDPRVPYMSQQKPDVLRDGMSEWRNPKMEHTFDQYVVFGHTPTTSIHRDIKENDARIWTSHRAKKIALDTGAGFGMRLTMADLKTGMAYAYDFSSREIIEYRFMRRK